MKTKYKCLYEITGCIDDVATFLVPINELPQQRTWVGLTDEEVRLIAYNECPEDWDSLENKECWLKGFVNGFKASEQEHKT